MLLCGTAHTDEARQRDSAEEKSQAEVGFFSWIAECLLARGAIELPAQGFVQQGPAYCTLSMDATVSKIGASALSMAPAVASPLWLVMM